MGNRQNEQAGERIHDFVDLRGTGEKKAKRRRDPIPLEILLKHFVELDCYRYTRSIIDYLKLKDVRDKNSTKNEWFDKYDVKKYALATQTYSIFRFSEDCERDSLILVERKCPKCLTTYRKEDREIEFGEVEGWSLAKGNKHVICRNSQCRILFCFVCLRTKYSENSYPPKEMCDRHKRCKPFHPKVTYFALFPPQMKKNEKIWYVKKGKIRDSELEKYHSEVHTQFMLACSVFVLLDRKEKNLMERKDELRILKERVESGKADEEEELKMEDLEKKIVQMERVIVDYKDEIQKREEQRKRVNRKDEFWYDEVHVTLGMELGSKKEEEESENEGEEEDEDNAEEEDVEEIIERKEMEQEQEDEDEGEHGSEDEDDEVGDILKGEEHEQLAERIISDDLNQEKEKEKKEEENESGSGSSTLKDMVKNAVIGVKSVVQSGVQVVKINKSELPKGAVWDPQKGHYIVKRKALDPELAEEEDEGEEEKEEEEDKRVLRSDNEL